MELTLFVRYVCRSNFVGTTFVGYDVEGSESELLKEDNALPEVVGVYYVCLLNNVMNAVRVEV